MVGGQFWASGVFCRTLAIFYRALAVAAEYCLLPSSSWYAAASTSRSWGTLSTVTHYASARAFGIALG